MLIRPAVDADLAAINEIYNHYVSSSTCTLQLEPDTLEERAEWFARHGQAHPILIAEEEGAPLGWASLSPYHARPGYRFTVEDSIYLRPESRGRGVGRRLLIELLARARAAGHHSVVAMVVGDELRSLTLHERLGFSRVALLHEVGFKLDRWVDVVFLQKMLA